MKKLISIVAVSALLTFVATVFPSFAQAGTATNAEIAELLVKVLGIELPAGTEDLPVNEYYEVAANILAVNGINNFVGAVPDAAVSSTEFITLLYTIVGGPGGANTDEMLKVLTDSYQMPAYDPNAALTFAKAADVLNNPQFATLVAEAYSAAEALERGGAEAPGFKLEETPGTTLTVAAASGV